MQRMSEFDFVPSEGTFVAGSVRTNIDPTRSGSVSGIAPRDDAVPKEQIVLMFHGLGTGPSAVPVEERPYWIGKSLFLEIVDLVRQRNFERDVVFTFDDGNASDLVAASELARAGLSGHFFLLAGRLNSPDFVDAAAAR